MREDVGGRQAEEVTDPMPQECLDLAIAEVNRLKNRVHQGQDYMADPSIPEEEKAKYRAKFHRVLAIYNSACAILHKNQDRVAIRTGDGEVIPLSEVGERLKPVIEKVNLACEIFDGELVPRSIAPPLPDAHPRLKSGPRADASQDQNEQPEGPENPSQQHGPDAEGAGHGQL